MKLISYTNISYLISLAVHLAVLGGVVLITYDPRPPVRSFQTAVFIEKGSDEQPLIASPRQNAPVTDLFRDIPLSKQHDLVPPVRKKKSTPAKRDVFQKPSLQKYITKPKPRIRNLDESGYLRANRRTEKPIMPLLAKKPDPGDSKMPASSLSPPDSQAGSSSKDQPIAEKPFIQQPGYTKRRPDKETATKRRVSAIWQKKSELLIYRNSLAKLVTANWIVPPTSVKDFKIMVEATIGPRGNLLSIRLLQGSGLAVLDAAAERAIRVSTPFPEFPTSFDKTVLHYRAVFRFTPDKVAN